MYNRPQANVFGNRKRTSESQDFRWTVWIQEKDDETEMNRDLFSEPCKYTQVNSTKTNDDGSIYVDKNAEFRLRHNPDITDKHFLSLESELDGSRIGFGIVGIAVDSDRQYMTISALRYKISG